MPKLIKGWNFHTRTDNIASEVAAMLSLEESYKPEDIRTEILVSQRGNVYTDIYLRKEN